MCIITSMHIHMGIYTDTTDYIYLYVTLTNNKRELIYSHIIPNAITGAETCTRDPKGRAREYSCSTA